MKTYNKSITIISCIFLIFINNQTHAQFEPKNQNGCFKGEFEAKINTIAINTKISITDPYSIMGNNRITYALWSLMGEPVYDYKFYWEVSPFFRITDYVYKGVKYQVNLSKYPDIKMKFDKIRPLKIVIRANLGFYSEKINKSTVWGKDNWFASCMHNFSIDLPSCAGDKNNFSMPGSKSWTDTYYEIWLGAVGRGSESMYFWEKENFKWGPMDNHYPLQDKEVREKALKKIFKSAEYIKVEYAEIIELEMPDIKYLLDEYCAKEEMLLAKANKTPAKTQTTTDDDFWNTTESTKTKIVDDSDFWNTTNAPAEIWMNEIEKADNLYATQKWKEAKQSYIDILKTNPELIYAKQQIDYIDKLLAYKPKFESDLIKPELIFVEGGTFYMGSNDNESNRAAPIHQVTISSFSIGKFEVTVEQYKAFCTATGRQMPAPPSWGWYDKHPMVMVNYNDCEAYCTWLSKEYGGNWRLPTEAEWEYAARGGNKSKGFQYSGSNDINMVGWYGDNDSNQTNSVGLKIPNELGIYDMSGNAWEWCRDWYGNYTSEAQTNPSGSTNYFRRVLRGGSCSYMATCCRVFDRSSRDPLDRFSDMGFRVVLSQ